MKKTIGLIAICLVIATTAFPAFAQQPAATPQQPAATPQQPATTSQDPQCTPENKLAWYNEFRVHFKGDTAKANDLAKKWLACPQAAAEEQQAAYLKNFVTLYEKATRKDRIHDFVYAKKDYAKAFEFGKLALADEPENLKILIDLAYAGYASKNPAYVADSLTYAQKAITLIESGKVLESWLPYSSKDDALGYLYNAMASLNLQKDPAGALKDFIKAAQFDGKIKKLPATYDTIARAYEAAHYAKLASDYELKHKGKDETPESKLALENINQVVDRMIDAYARAVALAGNEPAEQANKKVWMDALIGWYKYRTKSDVGLTELIAGILAKPLPPEPTPLTTLPVSAEGTTTTGTTPAAGVTTGAGATTSPAPTKPVATPANGGPTKPAATTTPAANNPAAATTPKPTATPKPATATTPKPKRNHRRRT